MGALDGGAGHDELTGLIHRHMEERLGPVPEGILTNLEWATPSYMAALGLIRLHKQRAERRQDPGPHPEAPPPTLGRGRGERM